MFTRFLVVGVAALALGLLLASPALAANDARGYLFRDGSGTMLADFEFVAKGEHVYVNDDYKDDWGVLVELWWDGKLRRWCWNTKSAASEFPAHCNFAIKDGKDITFYIALADRFEWKQCEPEEGCGKRKNFWAGADLASGCDVIQDPAQPCARGVRFTYPQSDSDFFGEA